jgi:hypothetical protein
MVSPALIIQSYFILLFFDSMVWYQLLHMYVPIHILAAVSDYQFCFFFFTYSV